MARSSPARAPLFARPIALEVPQDHAGSIPWQKRRAHYEAAARKLVGPQDLDALTAKNTGFATFADLVTDNGRPSSGYVPTIRPDLGIELAILADAFDAAQAARGAAKRAYRG
jgi:hypothetical protein